MKPSVSQKIESPCIRNCCLDKQDVCIGCGRSLSDIMNWQAFSDEDKLAALSRADINRQKLSKN